MRDNYYNTHTKITEGSSALANMGTIQLMELRWMLCVYLKYRKHFPILDTHAIPRENNLRIPLHNQYLSVTGTRKTFTYGKGTEDTSSRIEAFV